MAILCEDSFENFSCLTKYVPLDVMMFVFMCGMSWGGWVLCSFCMTEMFKTTFSQTMMYIVMVSTEPQWENGNQFGRRVLCSRMVVVVVAAVIIMIIIIVVCGGGE